MFPAISITLYIQNFFREGQQCEIKFMYKALGKQNQSGGALPM